MTDDDQRIGGSAESKTGPGTHHELDENFDKAGADHMSAGGLPDILLRFFRAWQRAESHRGCYSCSEPHDCRCPKDRGTGDCVCGRDELNKLADEIEKLCDIGDE